MFLPGAPGGLSLRHGPGHPHRRDGLHRRGRASRRAGEERRGAGADGTAGRHRPGDPVQGVGYVTVKGGMMVVVEPL